MLILDRAFRSVISLSKDLQNLYPTNNVCRRLELELYGGDKVCRPFRCAVAEAMEQEIPEQVLRFSVPDCYATLTTGMFPISQ